MPDPDLYTFLGEFWETFIRNSIKEKWVSGTERTFSLFSDFLPSQLGIDSYRKEVAALGINHLLEGLLSSGGQTRCHKF